jgi:Mlc titration factor MtfA (ptsG expression regulator)
MRARAGLGACHLAQNFTESYSKLKYKLSFMPLFGFLFLIACGVFGARMFAHHRHRQKRLATPLSDHQQAIVERQVPLVKKLPAEMQRQLGGKINLFVHQIDFIGCNDLTVTEEMQLSIAAQACLLIANTDMWYKNLRTILIYPSAFKSRESVSDGYVVTERERIRIGESWASGPVVLSWTHTAQGALIDDDGHNVVLHEFAHQLDSLSGFTDGAPVLKKGHSIVGWEQVFTQAYQRHVKSVAAGSQTVIDAFGATAPEEFFAVAVESFFETPHGLKQHEPEVYSQLSTFFALDPAAWKAAAT